MATFTITRTAQASPDEVWSLLGDLASAGAWVPGVVGVVVDGDTRVCTMADGSEIHERVLARDEAGRRLRLRHERHPLFRDSDVDTRVEPDGSGCTIVCDARVDLPEGKEELGAMVEDGFGEALDRLAAVSGARGGASGRS